MTVANQVMSAAEFKELFGAILETIDVEKLSSIPHLMKKAVRKIRNRDTEAARKASMKDRKRRSAALRLELGLPPETKEMRRRERHAHRNQSKFESGKMSKWQYWYTQYLLTPEWERIRTLILQRDSGKCRCCGSRADQVHHRSYGPDVMVGKDLDQLVAICDKCHNLIHKADGVKRKLAEVDVVLLEMMARRNQ